MTDDRDPFDDEEELAAVRREEEVEVGRVEREVGRVRLRKTIEEQPFEDVVARGVEHADLERLPADENDEGDVRQLADGSVSIPVFEEQIVVEKRLIVRERLVVRKRVESTPERIRATLRREVVEVEVDPEVEHRVHLEDRFPED